ncbi:Cache sensor-containing MCP-domain signal transduction protein [Campylobacter sp. RM16187]|nr:methyl-accepting chemotaxis protein [Campylobacter sp. RM16187]QKG29400.1 Cache sensor-containing MCP-domain signal transduction protein [Campylobacter sp. RM16187]
MRSITNKIAIMLIVALFISFAAISVVNYCMAQDKVVKLVNQNQEQILKDIKNVMGEFFDSYKEYVVKLARDIADSSGNDDEIFKIVKDARHWGTSLISLAYYGRESDGATFFSDGNPAKDYDPRTRGWYKKAKSENKPIFTEPYISVANNQLVVSFSAPVIKDGKLIGVASLNVGIDGLNKEILEMGRTEYSYIYVIEGKDAKILMHSNSNNLSKSLPSTVQLMKEVESKNFDENGLISYVNQENQNVFAKILPLNSESWLAVAEIEGDTFSNNTIPILRTQAILAIIFVIALSAFVYILLKKSLNPIKAIQDKLNDVFKFVTYEAKAPKKLGIGTNDEFGVMSRVINENIDKVIDGIKKDNMMIDELNSVANLMIRGNLGVKISSDPNNPSLLELKNLLNTFFASISENLKDITKVLSLYTKNDFTQKVELREGLESDLKDMVMGVKNMGDVICKMLQDNLNEAQMLEEKANILAKSMRELTDGTNIQANSLQESAAAVEQMSSSMNAISQKAEDVTRQSEEIKNIIVIIRDIADQTNLLALNAAIEAARAGEHGRGFAVVADEVRKLAERTQKSLSEIEANANVLAQSINEMSESIKEQAEGISMINKSISQIDDMTHQNIRIVDKTNEVTREVDKMSKIILADVRINKF